MEKKVADADPADYDALVLPGGVANPDFLRADEDAVRFIRDFVASGKPVSAPTTVRRSEPRPVATRPRPRRSGPGQGSGG